MTLDKNKLAVIHIVKRELGLSDREYRDRLEELTGVRSARCLDESGFRKLMNYFARSKYYRINQDGLTFRQMMYINGLKDRLRWEDLHFVNFLKKYYKKSDIHALTKKEAVKVIESLKNILEHERKKNPDKTLKELDF
jgi:tagatose-1,6-bisphosphate aldolase